ncbi:MAG: ABC transporter ATP-binding protein [Planctomycetota bacterium]|jgi:ABC-type multidrug transport system fused ATPase/permease subunit
MSNNQRTANVADDTRQNTTRHMLHYWRRHAGILALSFVSLVALTTLTLAKAWILTPIVDGFMAEDRSPNGIYVVCGIVGAILMGQAIVNWAYLIAAKAASSRVVFDIRNDIFDRLLRQGMGYYVDNPSSELTTRVINDLTAFQDLAMAGIQNFVKDALLIILLVGFLVSKDLTLALSTFAICGVTALLLKGLSARVRTAGRDEQKMVGRVANRLGEAIGGIELILSLGQSARWKSEFKSTNVELQSSQMRSQRTMAITVGGIGLILGIAIPAFLFVTGKALLEGEITAGQFAAIFAAIYLLQGPAQGIGNNAAYIARGLAAGDRAFRLLDDPLVMEAPSDPLPLKNATGLVVAHDLHFRYGGEPVLRGISFTIPPRQLAVIVGDSGAGKSTLAKLVVRLYDPSEGDVQFDGVPIQKVTQPDLYTAVGYVSQDLFLFDETLAFNLRIARPEATEEEMWEALRTACLDDFIESLPDGLQTFVGERGARLSGGQRQRLALARAFLRHTPILVLDEATSAMDTDLERRILANLVEAGEDRTIIAITHRLSLAQMADRVIVLKDGVMVEDGTAAELAESGGEFARLARASSVGTDDAAPAPEAQVHP